MAVNRSPITNVAKIIHDIKHDDPLIQNRMRRGFLEIWDIHARDAGLLVGRYLAVPSGVDRAWYEICFEVDDVVWLRHLMIGVPVIEDMLIQTKYRYLPDPYSARRPLFVVPTKTIMPYMRIRDRYRELTGNP